MHVRLTTYPEKTITFTSPHGVIVTMPIDVECTEPTELNFDLPALASISIVGEITSVTGGPTAPDPGPRMDQQCANCPHLRGDHADNIVGNPCLGSYIARPCDCRSFTEPR